MDSNKNSKLQTPNSKPNWNFGFGHWKLNPGFTLAEVTIGLTIIGFISVLVIAVYITYFYFFSNQNTSIDITSKNKIALDEITNQIRESQSVSDTCSDCGSDTTSNQVLILRLWPLDQTGEPTDPISSNYDYVVYKRDSADYTKLIKRVIPHSTSSRPGSEKIIATNISSLEFAYDSQIPTETSEIAVTITSTGQSLTKTHTYTLSAKALLRNK